MSKEEKELSAEEEFDQAFAEATSPSTEDEETVDQETSTEEEIPQTDDTEEDDDDEESAPSGETSDEESEDDSEESDETDYKALYEREQQRNNSWEGRIRAANKRAEEAEAKLKGISDKEDEKKTPPKETSEDDSIQDDPELKDFFEEFPELVKPFNTLVSKKGEAIARKIVSEEIQKLSPQLENIQVKQQQDADKAHFDAISSAHPDWRDLMKNGEIEGWVNKQPSFLRSRYTEVMKTGTTDEAIELLDTYKAQHPKEKEKKPSAKSKKAEALDAVPASSGGAPKGKPNKDDFDAAWEEAVGKKG